MLWLSRWTQRRICHEHLPRGQRPGVLIWSLGCTGVPTTAKDLLSDMYCAEAEKPQPGCHTTKHRRDSGGRTAHFSGVPPWFTWGHLSGALLGLLPAEHLTPTCGGHTPLQGHSRHLPSPCPCDPCSVPQVPQSIQVSQQPRGRHDAPHAHGTGEKTSRTALKSGHVEPKDKPSSPQGTACATVTVRQ